MGRPFNHLNILTNYHSMPKPLSGKILQLEIRLTPYDQQPITERDLQPHMEHIDKLLLCQEGSPNGSPKLHYHGFIETKKSESWLRKTLRELTHCTDTSINGNSLYFTRKPHEHTFGYITKSGNVSHRHGITQTTIDEWLEQSSQYAKDKATERKRKQRTRDDELAHVVEEVNNYLQNSEMRNEHVIVNEILKICHQDQIRFPSRSQMEMIVLKLLYPYQPETVRLYYTKSFQFFRT